MKALATMTAALGLLGAIGAATPASAAVGQCYDAYGRPFGQPFDTDHPSYGMICQAFRIGGHCTHVDPQWAASSCGLQPRGHYNRGYYRDEPDSRPHYRSRQYDYDRGQRYDYQRRHQFGPSTTDPAAPQPNTAR